MPQNSPDVLADAKALEKAANNFMDNSLEQGAANAFRDELMNITQHGYTYARKVFDQVKEDVGEHNWIARSASGISQDQLCFTPALYEQPTSTFVCAFTSTLASGRDENGRDIEISKFDPHYD